MMYKNYLKPLLDFLASLILIILFSPVLLIVGILVFFKLGSPVIFAQKRPGKNGKTFKMYKFRSMTNEKDESGQLLPKEKRLTSFGKKLRSTSLDELPELFNVLKGDMSIVGPRPLRIEYLPYYSPEQARRHDVKSGITGWAQINGRNVLSWEERFQLDVWYVDNVSFILDLKIIFKTIWKVIKREGVNSNDEKLMQPFKEAKLNG